MNPEIITFVDNENLILMAILLVLAFAAGMVAESFRVQMRREAWRERRRWRWRPRAAVNNTVRGPWGQRAESAPSKQPDAADQLRTVMGATFTIQPLLNKSELRVFKELDGIVIDCNPGWQVMAQVSLGEILRANSPEAYSCINAKRVDLLLVDDDSKPRHAIEYQGGAHYQGTAAARDAVKKEALRRAGIGYHEVVSGQTTPSELRRLVERLVEKPNAPQHLPVARPKLPAPFA